MFSLKDLKKLDIIDYSGSFPKKIKGLAYDSRECAPGYCFFALKGEHTDGHCYIDTALENGAAMIVHSDPLEKKQDKIFYLQVENTRRFMGKLAALFYDFPSLKISTIGITGTDGKSTTVYFAYQLLKLSGCNPGFISTVAWLTGKQIEKNSLRQSTPESPDIQRLLAKMCANKKDYAVIEATSHGLSEKNCRLNDVDFNVAVLTNVTQEHLEFHGSLEQYRKDKSLLFSRLNQEKNSLPKAAVINLDDPHYQLFQSAASSVPVYFYSMQKTAADLRAELIEDSISGSRFLLFWQNQNCQSSLTIPGAFNIENAMAALLAVSILSGRSPLELASLLPRLQGPAGRMERIESGQNFHVVLDYAHTPASFERLFPFVHERAPGRIIAVFGSAGERDRQKRPLQGAIASRYSDILILTDEDPRAEDSISILKEIQAGCKGKIPEKDLFLITDRKEAIRKAFSIAKKGDTVLLLGKGHESSIIYKEGAQPWNEAEIAKELLKERPEP